MFAEFFMPRFCGIVCVCVCVCVLCEDIMQSRTLYVFGCVVRMSADCGCVVSFFLLFLFIVCFVFSTLFVFVFLKLLLLHFLCQGFVAFCVCVVRGRYVLTHVACVRSCHAHDS